MSETAELPAQLVDLNLYELERDDASTQAREAIDPDTVERYGAEMKAGARFDPIVVYYHDGRYYVADGWHRLNACEFIGRKTIKAEVRRGDKQDARDHATSANGRHGLAMTNADKRKAVAWVLEDHPDWTDRAIANHVGVDHKTVAKARRELGNFPTSSEEDQATRVGQDGKEYPATQNRLGGPADDLDDDDPDDLDDDDLDDPDDRPEHISLLDELREPYLLSLKRLKAIGSQLNEWREDVECGAYVRQDFAQLVDLLQRLRSGINRLTPVRWCDQCDRSKGTGCGACLRTGFHVLADLEDEPDDD